MKISADWLNNPSTKSVMKSLVSRGYQAYFVGGCVRNALLNIESKDIEKMTTSEGTVTADCQFCGAHYDLSPETVGFQANKNGKS